ncbi:hypothetical protein [Kitasatospora sp. NPDC101183]|uniref:hypothetical protein n=1 Tax=Kitasatospora sp. NPDC101183 TaxID=3364100 RepID=UPI00380BBCB9
MRATIPPATAVPATAVPATAVSDAELVIGYHVEAALTRGLLLEGTPRRVLFGEAAIAACYQADALGTGPRPLAVLARIVRAGGFAAALDLPEPVMGREAGELVRGWVRAAAATGADLHREVLFSRWLEAVALFIGLRRRVRDTAPPVGPAEAGNPATSGSGRGTDAP